MSVGQIYRYFANKEAIIGSIVARDMQEAAAVREQMRAREVTDPVSELLEIATYKMDQLNPIRAALSLEILAEAARNPQVAEIVRGAERTGRGWLRELLVRHGAQEEGLEARMDLVILMVEGWTMRLVKNPDVDRAAYVESLREMLTHLFSCAEAEACR